jgi:protein tyrosine/serine phosphatase
MPRFLPLAFSLFLAGLIIGVPWWYGSVRHRKYRNLRVVEEGVLYRSGQMTVDGLRRVVEQKRIKTIVNLRDGISGAEELEQGFCAARGVQYVNIPQKPWSAADGSVPAEEGLKRFLAVMQDPSNYPVLLHCFAGHHRTGAYVAIYRMHLGGWTNDDAIREMYNLGYRTIEGDRDLHQYLLSYPPPKTKP